MLATHNQFTRQMRSHLKTIGIGLGLVRLLQDAKRFEEARATLYSLENGFQSAVIENQDAPAFCQSPNSFVAVAESNDSASASPQLDSSDLLA
jgi:hypothetical protein